MADEFFTRPLLFVQNGRASVAYYCEKLGFSKDWEHGGEKVIIAQVSRDGINIILDATSVLPKAGRPSVLSVSLEDPKKLQALYREFLDKGVKIRNPPFEVIWQKDLYQFDVEDLDGNVLVFWGEEAE